MTDRSASTNSQKKRETETETKAEEKDRISCNSPPSLRKTLVASITDTSEGGVSKKKSLVLLAPELAPVQTPRGAATAESLSLPSAECAATTNSQTTARPTLYRVSLRKTQMLL